MLGASLSDWSKMVTLMHLASRWMLTHILNQTLLISLPFQRRFPAFSPPGNSNPKSGIHKTSWLNHVYLPYSHTHIQKEPFTQGSSLKPQRTTQLTQAANIQHCGANDVLLKDLYKKWQWLRKGEMFSYLKAAFRILFVFVISIFMLFTISMKP